MKNIVYGLVDPRTLLVRYIGKSVTGVYRPRQHRAARALKEHNHKSSWIKSLLAAGLDYTITVLEEATSKEALADVERFWIAYGRACGWPLTNLTDGGDGGLSGYKQSPETIAKRTGWAKGRKSPPEELARLRTMNTGKKMPSEQRAKISAALKGRQFSPELRAKISAGSIAREARKRAAR